MIRQQHQIEGTDTVKDGRITADEMDAIRYAAGYMPRALQKFLRSAYPLKRQILLCLYDLINEGEDEADTTYKWMERMAKVTSHTVHNNAILYIPRMHIVCQSTPCAPSSNMCTLFYLLLQHAFSQTHPSIELACCMWFEQIDRVSNGEHVQINRASNKLTRCPTKCHPMGNMYFIECTETLPSTFSFTKQVQYPRRIPAGFVLIASGVRALYSLAEVITNK